ncbi:Predicted acyltransferase [Draconibacterium orientale]|uniref:Predicted acyltransferase n=1 Tax=Draconibacterium orientale TaxID=1168034 RepID=X5DZE3_9BACT|nr:DUF5009 domain-containing protein [Draconibacterium orientale]AHW60610.1 hypothetical protein FH5T_15800 [Draconibacterium orientale]SET05131.1 Predicted acyltransferase [Draconibacterium orientale]
MTEAIVTPKKRILAIDIMRGLTLFLMLFVNDLYESGVPSWLVHSKANVDGMGLADWVFPGFLFMVGLSIPYAVAARERKGDNRIKILGHILVRTISLLLIGVLMMNIGRLNAELSGINRNIWAILIYVSIFLVWNKYPESDKLKWLPVTLKAIGIIGIVSLVSIFRAGEPGHVEWLTTGWWGILGLIGWGYFTSVIVYLLCRSRLWYIVAAWLFFVTLNILSQLGLTNFLNFAKPVFGVIIGGNVPSIVIAGLLIGVILKQSSASVERKITIFGAIGIATFASGFILRNWFIISKIYGTPSWAMVCNGISILVFAFLLFLVDHKEKYKWAGVFRIAGQNSLTTYLAPDILYFSFWALAWPVFFYKQDTSQLLAVIGSAVWALAMIGFANLLSRLNIRLKL